MGLFGNKSFKTKKATVRKSVSLNNLSTNPTERARELHPDPENLMKFHAPFDALYDRVNPTSFEVGGTTLQIRNGQVLATGGGGANDVLLKQENQQLKEMVNKLRIEKELLLDMLAEITADYKANRM